MTFRADIVEDCRIVLGAVAPTPVRARLSEEMLKGQSFNNLMIDDLVQQVRGEIEPISDIRASDQYRLEVAGQLVVMAIERIMKKGGLTNGRKG